MNITVDRTKCQNHGQCAIAAPDVFQMDDEGELVFDPNPSDDNFDEVEEAADVCPVQAILIAD
jgi:ferredoxin